MDANGTFTPSSQADWRRWLQKHHESTREIWVVFYKKHTGKQCITYDEALDEALCFGWIDGILKRIDDERYMQRFTPRRRESNWSEVNRRRVQELVRLGRMTPAGLKAYNTGIARGEVSKAGPRAVNPKLPAFMRDALMENGTAWENFRRFPPSCRRNYILWVSDAKRPETRKRRLAEAVKMIAKNQKSFIK